MGERSQHEGKADARHDRGDEGSVVDPEREVTLLGGEAQEQGALQNMSTP